MRKYFITFAACALAGGVTLTSGELRAEESFYKGKTVTVVVGFGPGGGNDRYARALAQHIPKHIPGAPTVLVQNMPGAGSLTAVLHLDAKAPRDGTVMTNFQAGLITRSLVTPERVKIDFRKYNWIGVADGADRVCYGFGPDGVRSWDDMMARSRFVLGTTAKASSAYINGATLKKVFGAPIHWVLGYTGSAEAHLALERGEIDGSCGSFSSIPEDLIIAGRVHAFVRFQEFPPPEVPESAAYIGDFTTNEDQRQLLRVLTGTDQLGRTYIMSKDVPAERVRIMREAFNLTMKDKAFLTDTEKQKIRINPLTGEQAEKIVEELMAVPARIVSDAKEVYE